jgi:hypothetical protein
MTPHDLIAAFEALARTPEGVVWPREMILQLAVRGRLVRQDPREQPGLDLLASIPAEKSPPSTCRLIREVDLYPALQESSLGVSSLAVGQWHHLGLSPHSSTTCENP